MTFETTVQNGSILIPEGMSFADGTAVRVICYDRVRIIPPPPSDPRIELPLIRSEKPNSVELTNEMISGLMTEQDVGDGIGPRP